MYTNDKEHSRHACRATPIYTLGYRHCQYRAEAVSGQAQLYSGNAYSSKTRSTLVQPLFTSMECAFGPLICSRDGMRCILGTSYMLSDENR